MKIEYRSFSKLIVFYKKDKGRKFFKGHLEDEEENIIFIPNEGGFTIYNPGIRNLYLEDSE